MNFRLALSAALAILGACSAAAGVPGSSDAVPHPDQSGEYRVRADISEKAAGLFYRGQFGDLAQMEQQLLQSGERTPSGVSRVQIFNVGLISSLGPVSGADCEILAASRIDEWIASQPNSPAPYILKASELVDRAFCFRGTKAAVNVDDGAWEPFHRDLEAAHKLLDDHKAVASANPHFYAVMGSIYLGEGRSPQEFRTLLDEATKRFPTYLPIYDAAYTYFQPHWFGSAADLANLAEYMTERNRPTDGDGGYARYFWYASSTSCGCWKDAIDWPTMERSMADVSRRYPDKWNFAGFAKVACEFGDFETARSYFMKLGDGDGSETWAGDTNGWRKCRASAGF